MKKFVLFIITLLSSVTYAGDIVPIKQVDRVPAVHDFHVVKSRGVIAGRWLHRADKELGVMEEKNDGHFLATVSCSNRHALKCNYVVDFVSKKGTMYPAVLSGKLSKSKLSHNILPWTKATRQWDRISVQANRPSDGEVFIPEFENGLQSGSRLIVGEPGATLSLKYRDINGTEQPLLNLIIEPNKAYFGETKINRIFLRDYSLSEEQVGKSGVPIGTVSDFSANHADSLVCVDEYILEASCFTVMKSFQGNDMYMGSINGRTGADDIEWLPNGKIEKMDMTFYNRSGFLLEWGFNIWYLLD